MKVSAWAGIRMWMMVRATCFGDRLLQAAYPESVGWLDALSACPKEK